jgi:hypothetical protein
MSDTDTVEVDETDEETQPEGNGPPELRKALKRKTEEAAKYKKIVMADVYKTAGLDPSKGLGKAIAKEYDGEPTAEALIAYAGEEYGYEAPDVPDNPVAEEIVVAQAEADAIRSVTQPVVPNTPQEARREAEASRDWDAAGRIKADQLRKIMRP